MISLKWELPWILVLYGPVGLLIFIQTKASAVVHHLGMCREVLAQVLMHLIVLIRLFREIYVFFILDNRRKLTVSWGGCIVLDDEHVTIHNRPLSTGDELIVNE